MAQRGQDVEVRSSIAHRHPRAQPKRNTAGDAIPFDELPRNDEPVATVISLAASGSGSNVRFEILDPRIERIDDAHSLHSP